jgi:hypothetical protein
MTTRIFVLVRRGRMDATPTCIYPWEKQILELIHGQDVQDVSVEEMAEVKEGVSKKTKMKFKYDGLAGPDLRQQLEVMAYVDPEDDPASDPMSEYNRLIEKYGMDAEYPMPVVERVFGRFDSGGFERILAEHAKQRSTKPSVLKAMGEGLSKAPSKMNVGELRKALDERQIAWETSQTKQELVDLLEGALVE